MTAEGQARKSIWQVADMRRPLMSASKVIEAGNTLNLSTRNPRITCDHHEHTPFPEVFHEGGGHRPAVGGKGKGKTGKVWGWKDERVHSVMGLVQMHEGEYRRWHPAWGPSPGGNEDWQKILQPAVGGLGADHPFSGTTSCS